MIKNKPIFYFLFLTSFIFISSFCFSQNELKAVVVDNESQEPLIGANILLKDSKNGAITFQEGHVTLKNIPDGNQTFIISFIGYQTNELNLVFPLKQKERITIYLTPSETEIDEIIIEATRANKSVANLPTRTEVLTEEIDEAASMEPSKIAHLITHSTGIQVQTTSASSNGAVVRIQGLNGRYTQMLKDGFPLYGGFSGSLDVLQIPPLDLRQVEYIKGSASTLYGGGAIGGLINLLTKKATKDETLLHINFSHIGAKDFNSFVSRKFGKFGFTNLASMHLHSPYDPDDDGFSDVPEVTKFNFNPKLFYYPDSKTELYLGATITKESRLGGDMNVFEPIIQYNWYYDQQKSNRYTTQFSAKREFSKHSSLSLKNSVSLFDRHIVINSGYSYPRPTVKFRFAGSQLNSFSELNFKYNKKAHDLTLGLNSISEKFSEHDGLNPLLNIPLRDQQYTTYGVFLNHLWDVSAKFALETGLRTDYVLANTLNTENDGETFILPRISALYKLNTHFSFRLGGGMGYRMPTIFNEEAEPYGYRGIAPIDFENLQAERSYGGNLDLKYQTTFGSDNILLTINQMFFYNLIDNPIRLNMHVDEGGWDPNNFDPYITFDGYYTNTGGTLNSQGFETQIKLTVWKFTWFFGYTYTDAFLQDGSTSSTLNLTPKHSIKGDLLFVVDNKWRIGWDYEYKSEQVIGSYGYETPSLFTTGIVVERTLANFVIFLNAENFTDTRQTAYGDITTGPFWGVDGVGTPQFTEIWAPLDGFFFNAGLKIKL